MRRFKFGVVCLSLVILLTASLAVAATAEQEEQAKEIDDILKQAGKLVVAKKYAEATPLIVDAQDRLLRLSAEGDQAKPLVSKLLPRLTSARRILEKNGQTLPAMPAPGEAPVSAPGASFTKDVVPILVGKCNNCHISGTRGGFNMATFSALMKGAEGGAVVLPGMSKGSRLVEVIESGDMPRGGGRVTPEELATISKWIDAGAKFDGRDVNGPISTGTPIPMQRQTLQVVQATGSEKSKFSRDIAPILASECMGCHGGQQPARQLGLDTFTRMLAGNNDGIVIVPGKPDESLLIRKIKGMAGARMPLNRPALSDEVIAAFELWVTEGAKFDGDNAGDPVELVANVYKASQMTHDELAAYRSDLAMKNWGLSNPDEEPEQAETENFLMLGNVGEDRLLELGKVAEEQVAKVGRILKAPPSEPILKGRMTLFVFNQRYDYSEYGQMVEKREIPDQWQGHWRYNVVDAYGCVLPPREDEYSLAGLMAQQIAGAYLENVAKVPSWFSQGSAWAVAARVDPKDPRVKAWDDSVPSILGSSKKADDFLTGALPPGDTSVLNYSFASFLMSNNAKYSALLSSLKRGTPFDAALQQVYGGTPSQLTIPWVGKVVSRRGRK